MNYDERTADVRSFLSSTIMEKVRFEDVVELGKLGNGIDWEQPRQEDVGKYIAIFWPDDGRWYSAKIDRVNSRTRYLWKNYYFYISFFVTSFFFFILLQMVIC